MFSGLSVVDSLVSIFSTISDTLQHTISFDLPINDWLVDPKRSKLLISSRIVILNDDGTISPWTKAMGAVNALPHFMQNFFPHDMHLGHCAVHADPQQLLFQLHSHRWSKFGRSARY